MEGSSLLSTSHGWLFYILVIGIPVLLLSIFCCLFFRKPFIKSLKGKHVFITGGSTGIGLAIARTVLREGAVVTLISRNASNLSSAVEYLLGEVPSTTKECIRCEVADVADYAALSSAIERAFTWRPIDVFVCNAGLTRGGYLGDGQLKDLEVTVQTNFMGSVNALHAALPLLKRHSCNKPVSIVITASLASLFFMYGHAVYTATKFGMRGLAEGLRFELLPYNMKVSLICPGFTSTPFLDEADKEEEICKLLKWVNLYSRAWAESAEGVATHTVAALKAGSFLVTTNPLGLVLATLARGFVPSDSLPRLVFELFFFIPFRLSSMIIIPIFRLIVCRKRAAATHVSPSFYDL
ncbi:hypothetical protein GOP47_0012342 [Adiantum capillus-veneris]|uniref:Uncharacterized protein n=1 Tax=Adiantum capillus-veneris TaxID=13818 RepID=A0A9D4ZGS1_ADICA|nr:hypothetical protein GOP47_0012342 [Adiantum capillus-veneris]